MGSKTKRKSSQTSVRKTKHISRLSVLGYHYVIGDGHFIPTACIRKASGQIADIICPLTGTQIFMAVNHYTTYSNMIYTISSCHFWYSERLEGNVFPLMWYCSYHYTVGVIITARREVRQVLFLALWLFCSYMKYPGNRWMDLRQTHTEDVLGPSLGRVWRSRSKIRFQGHQGQNTAFFGRFGGLSAVCGFGKTALASSLV